MAPSLWSRFTTRRTSSPAVFAADEFLTWLLDFGAKNPGHVLYPTSDDTAFLYSLAQDRLGEHFSINLPPIAAVYGVLNKRQLATNARAVGLCSPEGYSPSSVDDCAHGLEYPVLIKPVTQILNRYQVKGTVVRAAAELPKALHRAFAEPYAATLMRYDPDVSRPIIQAFHANAAADIFSVSGYVGRDGQPSVFRASRKILQQPRTIGVGVVFEDAPLNQALCDGLVRLCRHVGYFGVFEAEFIVDNGAHLLIDFNPRFFGQMGFDIARQSMLPLIAYADATNDAELLRSCLARAEDSTLPHAAVFMNRIPLEIMLRAQRLSGAMPKAEYFKWREYFRERSAKIVDAVADPDDPKPSLYDAMNQLTRAVKYPRSFLRTMVFNRP